MPNNYRKRLFDHYHSTHAVYVSMDAETQRVWFGDYVRGNYLPLLKGADRSKTRILEIGCSKGFALLAFKSLGFSDLSGIDMSPEDVKKARELVPSAKIQCMDAHVFLKKNKNSFDVILLKAVLEHIPKDQVLPFLESMREGLRVNGRVIVDVPNMDWIVAQHERYMDFTHENGFTRESLGQIMRNVFSDVSVVRSRAVTSNGLRGLARGVIRPIFLAAVKLGLRMVGEGASDIWWDSRSITAVGKK